MTAETKTIESVGDYVREYEFRGDGGDYTPNEGERLLIEDAIHGFISAAPASPPAETGEGVGAGLVKVTIFCPNCSVPHVDEGEWTTRPHKTHQCQSCGEEWRPFPFNTVGIAHPASDQSDTERMRAALEGLEDILADAETRAATRWDQESPDHAWRPGLLAEVNAVYQACAAARAALAEKAADQ